MLELEAIWTGGLLVFPQIMAAILNRLWPEVSCTSSRTYFRVNTLQSIGLHVSFNQRPEWLQPPITQTGIGIAKLASATTAEIHKN